MVIIDTYGKAAAYDKTGQENDTATNKIIMRHLSEAGRAAGCFVMAVDHFGKDVGTGTRGSSSKEDDADVVLALLGDKDITGKVTNTRMTIRKRRNGSNGDFYHFTPREVDVNEGVFTTNTLVIDWTSEGQEPQQAAAKKDPWGTKSLKQFKRALDSVLTVAGSMQLPYLDGPRVRAANIESRAVRVLQKLSRDGRDIPGSGQRPTEGVQARPR